MARIFTDTESPTAQTEIFMLCNRNETSPYYSGFKC